MLSETGTGKVEWGKRGARSGLAGEYNSYFTARHFIIPLQRGLTATAPRGVGVEDEKEGAACGSGGRGPTGEFRKENKGLQMSGRLAWPRQNLRRGHPRPTNPIPPDRRTRHEAQGKPHLAKLSSRVHTSRQTPCVALRAGWPTRRSHRS